MKTLLPTIVSLFFLLVPFFLLFAPEVTAQSPSSNFGLSLTPPVRYITVPSNSSKTTSVVLKNTTSSPQTFTLTVYEFTPDQITAQPVLGKPAPSNLISISDPQGEIHLQAGESKTVYVKISAPAGKIQQEHHWSIVALASQLELTPGSGATAHVAGGLASNLIVFFGEPSNVPNVLELDKITMPKTIDSFQGLPFSFYLKNTGVQATIATGSATISNVWFPDQTETFPIHPDVVLAGSSRLARNEQGQPFLFKKPFLFGIYTITVNSDSEGKSSIIIGNVLAFPWSILLSILFCWVFFVIIKKIHFSSMLNYFLPNNKKPSNLE